MRRFLLCATLMSSMPALADAEKYELQFSPNLGYSNFSGFHLGMNASLAVPLSERWQWQSGMGFTLSKRLSRKRLSTGAVYNFSDDWSEAFFVGGGVGFEIADRVTNWDEEHKEGFYGYADFGKRFRLNKSGNFSWTPKASVTAGFDNKATVSINPLNFSWSF